MTGPHSDEIPRDVERLRRWEDSGAIWRVVDARSDGVTIAFCRCDGGEEVDRWYSTDPRLVDYLAGRDTNEIG